MLGESLIRWSARFAVACYAGRLLCDANGTDTGSSNRAARWWWTAGCAWFVVHVAAAFHFEHGWSHLAAYESTAKRTAEMTGWDSGIGLYVNYAFLCLWLTDTVLWWRNPTWPRHRRTYWTVQAVFAFLMIQATAIFGPPFWKPIVLLFVAVLLFQILRFRSVRRDVVSSLEGN